MEMLFLGITTSRGIIKLIHQSIIVSRSKVYPNDSAGDQRIRDAKKNHTRLENRKGFLNES